jgi:putative hydrolase of the HAD superfamily
MRLKAVLFDAGNTVILINYAAVTKALAQEGFDVQEAPVREAEYRARVRIDPILAQRHSTEAPEIFRTYVRYVFEGVGVEWGDPAERAFEAIADYNRRQNLWNRPHPQAGSVLRSLRRSGLQIGMISNSDGSVERIVTEGGLRPYFSFILDSRVVGVEKPDPQIFQIALDRAAVEPGEALYIGDLYSVDVLGARAAGLDTILLDPSGLWNHVECVRAKDLNEAAAIVLGRRP